MGKVKDNQIKQAVKGNNPELPKQYDGSELAASLSLVKLTAAYRSKNQHSSSTNERKDIVDFVQKGQYNKAHIKAVQVIKKDQMADFYDILEGAASILETYDWKTNPYL
ncbi:MAG: hypothetical protein MHPSP_003736, partial [Paramarteilia canceri]